MPRMIILVALGLGLTGLFVPPVHSSAPNKVVGDRLYIPIAALPREAPPSCHAAHSALDREGDGVLDESADAATAVRLADACFRQHGGTVALVLRARANAKLGRRDQAVADLTEALRVRPNDADLHLLRAAAYEDAALADLDHVTRLRPGDPIARKHKLTGHVTLIR